jgi:protoporphyrinogen oxidase
LRQQSIGIALAGNGFRGIGVPDCVRSGREAAKQVLS